MIPTLETERLILSHPDESDIPFIQEMSQNWEVIRHFAFGFPQPYPDNGAEEFMNNVILPNQGKTLFYWKISLKENPGKMIGSIEIRTETHGKPGTGNRGFWIDEEYWSNGYMTEACKEVNRFAFEELKIEKMLYANAVGNPRSRRIKEKTGAKFIEIRPFKHVDPELTESEVWELTREDWLKSQKS